MRFGGDYVKKTEAEYDEQVRARLENQFKRRAAELGFMVTKIAAVESNDSPVSATVAA